MMLIPGCQSPSGAWIYRSQEGHRRAWASARRPGSTAGVSRSKMAFADGDPLASRTTGDEMTISLKVNGSRRSVRAEADTPLLYVLRTDLALNGAKFGCGLAQ